MCIVCMYVCMFLYVCVRIDRKSVDWQPGQREDQQEEEAEEAEAAASVLRVLVRSVREEQLLQEVE